MFLVKCLKWKKKKETSTWKTNWKFRSLKPSSTVSRFLLCNKHIDFLCISYHKSVLNDADEDNVREYYLAKRGSYKNAFKPNFSSKNIRTLAFFTQFCQCWSFTKRRASTKSYIKALFYLFLWADLRLPQVFHEWIPQTRGNSLWSVVRRKTSWTPSLSSSFPFMLSDFPLNFVNTTANKAKINNTFLIIAIKEISRNIFQVKKLMTCFWQ